MPAPLPPLNRVPGSGKGASDDYHILELVGEGSFGKVYKARRKFTGAITAMKFIAKHGKTEKDIKSLRQEIEILRGLKHENIIAMVDSFETKAEFCVVTEFAQGELFDTDGWREQQTQCHTKKSLWQDQACQLRSEVAAAWAQYQAGFLQTLQSYNDVVARVMIEEADRKVEWEVLTRVICLLLSLTVGQGEAGAVSSEDNQARIQLCWDQEVDTSHLDIIYPVPPSIVPPVVLPPWPCDADYLDSHPIFSSPIACNALEATHGSVAESSCPCEEGDGTAEPEFALGHLLMIDPAIQITVSNAATTWSTTLSDGTVFSGAMSPIHREAMPQLTNAFFTEDEMEDSDVDIAGVAWAYGSSETTDGPTTLQHRFANNGGLLFVNQNDEVVQVRQLQTSSTNLNQDVAAYLSFSPHQAISVEQFAAACPTPQEVTDAWYRGLGAQQYCWIKSGLDMCQDGCFAYKMQDDSRIVFPLIEGAFASSLGR